MDAASVTPRFRLALGVAVSAVLLVPLAVYGAPAIAKSASSASHQYRAACGQYGSSGHEYGSSDDEYGSSDDEYGSSGSQYGSSCRQYRVQICHRTHSWKHPWWAITVSSRALKAHLRHGDTLPPCSTAPASKRKHGKGHGHGKHNDAGSKHGDAGTKHDRD
jgi:hypothetical protein